MDKLRLRYQTFEFGDVDVHVRSLRDLQEFRDDGGEAESYGISSSMWARFGVVWAAGHMLAQVMLDVDVAGRRVLEVGCGIAVASLLLRERGADVTATDRHPEAARFLAANVALNGGRGIPFFRESWEAEPPTRGDEGEAPAQAPEAERAEHGKTEAQVELAPGQLDGEGERFDLIIGSDVLYERDHGPLLAGFIERHAEPTCEVYIVDARRGEVGRFTTAMEALGFERQELPLPEPLDDQPPFSGRLLRFARGGAPVGVSS